MQDILTMAGLGWSSSVCNAMPSFAVMQLAVMISTVVILTGRVLSFNARWSLNATIMLSGFVLGPFISEHRLVDVPSLVLIFLPVMIFNGGMIAAQIKEVSKEA